MAIESPSPHTPTASRRGSNSIPSPNPNKDDSRASQASNSSRQPLNNKDNNNNNDDNNNNNCVINRQPVNNNPLNVDEFILSVASKIASQPLQYSDPDVWAVLTAISDKARKRRQVVYNSKPSPVLPFILYNSLACVTYEHIS